MKRNLPGPSGLAWWGGSSVLRGLAVAPATSCAARLASVPSPSQRGSRGILRQAPDIPMPKIVDHAKRRDEIAYVACRGVAGRGFERATVARIARAAGYTTGMVAHYYDSKQDIILAALRLMLLRIEERLTRERSSGEASLLSVLSEALAIDATRFTECAFWMAFWGQVSVDRKLKRLNVWVHREYMRLFTRCLAEHWPEWRENKRMY